MTVRCGLCTNCPVQRTPVDCWISSNLKTFITSQKQNVIKNFMPAYVRRGQLIWDASHRGIMMAAVSSKCKESLHFDKSWPVRVKVLKTSICMAQSRTGSEWRALFRFNVFFLQFFLTTNNHLSYNMYRIQSVKYMYINTC